MKELKEDVLFAEDINDVEMAKEAIQSENENDKAPNEAPEYYEEDEVTELADAEVDAQTDSSDDPTAEELSEEQMKLEALRAEIKTLREQIEQLEELKRANNRMLSEIGDFTALFPDVPIEEIPDSVWESVKSGAPLAASYALYERKMAAEAMRIAKINAKNASRSPGAAGTDTAAEYFSPEDVRRMSRAEVHANYSKIKESMKKWM